MSIMDGYCSSTSPNDDIVIITSRGRVGRKQGILTHVDAKKILRSVIKYSYDEELTSFSKEEDGNIS